MSHSVVSWVVADVVAFTFDGSYIVGGSDEGMFSTNGNGPGADVLGRKRAGSRTC